MTRFVFWMLLASALGFIKLIALAYAMPPHDYGQYVAHFGIATLSGSLMSAGLIEKTIKAYPRQWVTGQRRVVLADALQIARTLGLRFLIAGALGALASVAGWVPFTLGEVVWTTGLGACTAWLALLASLYRAVGSQKALQNFTWWRSAATLAFSLPAGWLLGWQGAMGGDIIANLLGVVIGLCQLPRLYHDEPAPAQQASESSEPEKGRDIGHHQLYLANLAVSAVTMADKAWVSAAIGATLAGTYGVVMLIPQIAQLLVNVVVQHIGPLVIKFAHLKQRDTGRVSAVGLQASLLALFSLLLTAGVLAAKHLPYLDHLFAKFDISDLSLILAGMIAAGQIYSVIEFHLIARDRERDVLAASAISGLIFVCLFSMAALLHAKTEWFIAAAGISRWSQVWILRRAYLRHD
ncbi:hypothetical protein [Herbaspirillum chlorophenolicum]|uniref:hypothetical protein n=1 Tax=Herbaspirillum chlorophenolicum TaxID=211589 RepID=UPI00067C14C9|nr:hypothetical protein [Herbaspirillum chlorophenolicum]